MEMIFWLVVAFFIGRRWLRKHPEKAVLLKDMLRELQAGRQGGAKRNLTTLLAHKPEAVKPETIKPATPPQQQALRGTLHTAKPHQQPQPIQQKKREKQFEQL